MSSPWDAAPPGRQPPKDELERAGDGVTRVVQNVAQFKKLLADMGTPRDSTNLRSRLKQTREQTTKLAADTLKQLQGKFNLADAAVKRRHQKMLETFKSTMTGFQALEQQYMQNEKQLPPPPAPVTVRTDNPLRSPTGRTPLNPMDSPSTAEQEVQLQVYADSQVAATRQAIQAEKEQELRAAAKDLSQLQDMMKDINIMLDEQGVMVDTIQSNTEAAADNTQAGTEDLGKAREYLNSYRCKCAILWTVIGVIVAVVVIVVVVVLVQRNQSGGGGGGGGGGGSVVRAATAATLELVERAGRQLRPPQ